MSVKLKGDHPATARIVVKNEEKKSNPSSAVVFLISWKATGKQMVVYHTELTVPRCSSGTIATCPVFPKKKKKKQAIICLEVLRARATFVGFDSY